METCININHPEFRALKCSGLPELTLKMYSRKYLDEHNRYPHLDELPHANSEPYLKELLRLSEYNSTSVKQILDFTGVSSIEEAVVKLNDIYRDLQIELRPLENEVIVNIEHRPTTFSFNPDTVNEDEYDWTGPCLGELSNSSAFLNRSIAMLAKNWGIPIETITSLEVESMGIPNAWNVNAFVHNGTIYVNTDVAELDAPLHELMHLFIGSLKTANPNLYLDLLNSIETLDNYEELLSKYSERSRNDANEEILVSEFSKFINGFDSSIPFNKDVNYEIFYNIDRMLDFMLKGELSTRTIPNDKKINMSLLNIGLRVRSASYNERSSFFSIDDAQIHQMVNNAKKDLMKKGRLIEECS